VYPIRDTTRNLQLLSELSLTSANADASFGEDVSSSAAHLRGSLLSRSKEDFFIQRRQELEDLTDLANKNHVIMRSFVPLQRILEETGHMSAAEWVSEAIQKEAARITRALTFLEHICAAFERASLQVTVIKSLDHWPDLGSDLDLYTDADPTHVIALMRASFNAQLAPRSWGDRLANKWNFIIPGLPELVEIHMCRLGQMGEQTALTDSLMARIQSKQVGIYRFNVAAPEERIIISTLQRMYRHFYIRLCDVVDNAHLIDSGAVDFGYLRALGWEAGLWEGIATYLTLVSGYVALYRGHGIELPPVIKSTSRFGLDQVRFRRDFLRIPILPHAAVLYASELKHLFLKGQLQNTIRLSLLPGLATAAALEQAITGSDKGIW
jgi:hypothetical protein